MNHRAATAPPDAGTVLIVDDEPPVRDALRRVLVPAGFCVIDAEGADAALRFLEHTHSDLVLTDLVMPGMDGIELCRRIKQDARLRLVPVVLVTGAGDRLQRLRGIEAGADDFLTKPVDPPELIARARSLVRLKTYTDQLEHVETVLLSLARGIEGKDPYTRGHCERLSVMSARLAQVLGLPDDDVEALRRGGILHDIGKIGVPDAILLKTHGLTDDEWSLMKRHTVIGEYICGPIRSLRDVLPIIRHHHERLDGSGYPDGLFGAAVPLTAQVLQVVDIYDAVRSARPYKKSMTHDEAITVLRRETDCGWRDAEIVRAFVSLIDATAAVPGTGVDPYLSALAAAAAAVDSGGSIVGISDGEIAMTGVGGCPWDIADLAE